MATDEREQIKKYFEPIPKWTVLLIIVGVVCLYAYGLGIILIGAGVWGIVSWSKRPGEAQMDAWLDEDLGGVRAQALERAGLRDADLVAPSVVVTGPRLWEVGTSAVAYRRGKDGRIRYTPVAFSVLSFTRDGLACDGGVLDLATGEARPEASARFPYAEVATVAIRSKARTLQIAGKTTLQVGAAAAFELTTSRGTTIEVLLRDPSLEQLMGGGRLPVSSAEAAVEAILRVLGARKSLSA